MKNKGISLIVLIITIVVIIILAASIILNLTNSNMLGNAKEAVLMQDIATLKSELELYVSDRFVDEKGKYDRVKLNADYETATYGTESIADKNGDGESNVYDILTVLKSSNWDKKVYIKEGVLVFKNHNLSKDEIETILGTGAQVEGIPQIKEIGVQSGYTSITVSLNIEEADKVEKYIYRFNNGEAEESTETIKTYTGLTADTNYMFEVVAVLSNGIEITKKQIVSTKSLNGQIGYTPSETEWTNKDVTVTIEYSEEILDGYELQYKLSGGMTADWTTYTGPVTITENATTLVGRVYNSILEEEKIGSSIVVSNIDKDVPTMPEELTLTSGKDSITAKASGSTDVTSGVKHYEYSIDNKTWQTKDTFTGLEIGEYTVYARAVDMAGNVSEVKTGTEEVKIQIEIAVEYVDLLNAKVTIDYGNVSNPEYKIGTNGTWQTYEDAFTINSQDIINKKLYNEDYTLTIYARGTSSSGVQGTVNTVIDKIDLQAPEVPVITSSGAQYSIITSSGVGITGVVSISYPENVKKLYSLDGENWQEYTGEFETDVIKVYAKAVKESGLETSVEATMSGSLASNALGENAFDGSTSSYDQIVNTSKRIYLSENMQGKTIIIKAGSSGSGIFASCDENDKETTLKTFSSGTNGSTETIIIPNDCKYLKFTANGTSYFYELIIANEPIITSTKYYPILTQNGVSQGYNDIEIEYFETSVQKLYRIGADGEWQTYTGKFRAELDKIVYAKGIDKNNKETRIVSEYTSALPNDGLGKNAYDTSTSSYDKIVNTSKKIYLSENMQGKTIIIKAGSSGSGIFASCDENDKETTLKTFSSGTNGSTETVIIPNDCKYLKFTANGTSHFYEIIIANEPIITSTKYYPILTQNGVTQGYNDIEIEYFPTSVQKLYRIGSDGEWQTYTGKFRTELDKIVYAKGIDANNKETRIVSEYTSALPNDGLGKNAYDTSTSSYDKIVQTSKKIYVSSEIQGKSIVVKVGASGTGTFIAVNASGTETTLYTFTGGTAGKTVNLTIPSDCEYLKYTAKDTSHFYYIQVSN